MGVLVGMVVYPIISPTRRHRVIVWWLRLAAIPLAVLLFVLLTRNFYKSDPYAGEPYSSYSSKEIVPHIMYAACSWCRYLSCIPSSINNYCKG